MNNDYSVNSSTSPNKVIVYDANEEKHVIDYTDITPTKKKNETKRSYDLYIL